MHKANTKLRLIEVDRFPFEFVSALAERESWRKEVHRPIYHVHKWWAKRLGSVFRAVILGSLLPEDADLAEEYYRQQDFTDIVIFDPFMGSGTTVGETHKLGGIALGRDINPIACESVRVALGPLDRRQLQNAFAHLSATVGARIRELYRSIDKDSQPAEVLYYFWVKQVPCPSCEHEVDLFSSRVIARNAYPDRKPEVQVCCPNCGDMFSALFTDRKTCCPLCQHHFDPQAGAVQKDKATCPGCSSTFSILEAVRSLKRPPDHRLYGKLLLTSDGSKQYAPATFADLEAYHACIFVLARELVKGDIRLPSTRLVDGYNTRQAINYNYDTWRDFFNARQLLALGWLQQAISELSDSATRDAFLLLFSGILEFNNLFASYKGEGTGAVRHMFAHHILKPERTPIEANVWGTPKSSGSFSNLFKTRLLNALNYRDAPYEVTIEGSGKAHFVNPAFSGQIDTLWPKDGNFRSRGIYLSCGSSDETGLPDNCVDFVITDPPFFDNVHYSELADFFFAWQSLYPRGMIQASATTRHPNEVQDGNAKNFATKLQSVFRECRRILKDDGLLVFTYHHSRAEGWLSLIEAIFDAGFSVVNAHPVKAEMSVAAPKAQAKEPIQLDVIIVCKHREKDGRPLLNMHLAFQEAVKNARHKTLRISSSGLSLSRNDLRIILYSQFICALGPALSANVASQALRHVQTQLDDAIDPLAEILSSRTDPRDGIVNTQTLQLTLPLDL